jgi:hypothetical protein
MSAKIRVRRYKVQGTRNTIYHRQGARNKEQEIQEIAYEVQGTTNT